MSDVLLRYPPPSKPSPREKAVGKSSLPPDALKAFQELCSEQVISNPHKNSHYNLINDASLGMTRNQKAWEIFSPKPIKKANAGFWFMSAGNYKRKR
jgi:hypothetical protein